MADRFIIRSGEVTESGLLGLWHSAPIDFFSFSKNTRDDKGDAAICSVILPENPELAATMIRRLSANLEITRQVIPKGGLALKTINPDRMQAASFEGRQGIDSPEINLLQDIAYLKGETGSFSFGIGDPLITEFQTFAKQAANFLSPTVYIETLIQEMPAAQTRVSLKGDFQTLWYVHVRHDHIEPHKNLLSYTLESRRAIMQIMAQTAIGAVALAAKFSIPGGAIMALPAAWRYIRSLISSTKKLLISTHP